MAAWPSAVVPASNGAGPNRLYQFFGFGYFRIPRANFKTLNPPTSGVTIGLGR